MKTIVFANFKGGAGKTTLCHHVAYAAADQRKRVLVIDCDQQGDLYRRFASQKDHPEDRPPVTWAPGCVAVYSPNAWELPREPFDLVLVDTAPALALPKGPVPSIVVAPIDGIDAALNVNDTVARALAMGTGVVVVVRNGTSEGARGAYKKEFQDLCKGAPERVLLCDVDVPRAASIKRSAFTCRPAWTDPYREAGATKILSACKWVLQRAA